MVSTESFEAISGKTDKGVGMKTSEMVAIIHRGIYREKEAIRAYIEFAKRVKDPKAKNVLINLAADEVGHMTKLEKHMMSLLKGQPWVLPKAEEIRDVAAVFAGSAYEDLDIKDVDLAKADEVKILQIAVEREIVANKFYIELAGKSKSDEAKKMFLSLAKEEEVHMKILRAEIDSIGQNGFWFDMQEFSMEM